MAGEVRSQATVNERRRLYEAVVRKRFLDIQAILAARPEPGGLFVSSLLAGPAMEFARYVVAWEALEAVVRQPDEDEGT